MQKILITGAYVSPEIALGGFHSATGWIGFIAVALSMVAVSRRSPFFAVRQSKVETEAREGDPTAAYLAPLMALLAISLVTGVFASGFDWFYPVRVLETAAVIWFFWWKRLTRIHLAGIWSGSAIAIGAAVFVVWLGLEWALGNTDTGSVIPGSLAGIPAGLAAAWLIFRVIGSVITVPIAEELAFRGYTLRRLISSDFDKISPRFTWFSFFVVVCSVWRPARTLAGRNRGWDVLRLGDVPAGQGIGCHNGPCHYERPDRRGGSDL